MNDEAKPVDPLDTAEVNQAAYVFQQIMPQIKSLSRNLGGKATARVLSAVMEFPLADKYPTFRKQEEKDLFMMCLQVQGAKTVMHNALMSDKKRVEEINNAVVDGVVDQLKKEMEDGKE